jgi:hypothetical protein
MNEKNKTIVNLTQHKAASDQIKDGVFDLSDKDKERLSELLTFDEPPSPYEIVKRAREVVKLAAHTGVKEAMIGGAPYLMPALEAALIQCGIKPLYAFTRREIIEGKEIRNPDGSVIKQSVFRHIGFIDAEHIRKALKREGIAV